MTFPAVINLADLDGTNGFRLDGIDGGSTLPEQDRSGYSVSSAGDVNGDGFDDVIIGAFLADPGGVSGAGESYVVFGKGSGFSATLALASLDGTNGFRLDGIAQGDYSGFAVSGAGDINGDGFADIIIGAARADRAGFQESGEGYVVFGAAGGFGAAIDLATLDGNNGFRMPGFDMFDRVGSSVSGAGDVNGDGLDDFLVGARGSGQSFLVFGRTSGFGADLDLMALDGSDGFRLDGVDGSDSSGVSISGAGDVNGDGFADIIIGAVYADPGGVDNAGESYVVFGKASGFGATLSLAALDGSNGFRLAGIDGDDRSSRSVSSAGDINGDGFDDIIVGAVFGDPGGNNQAGESYVVFGKASGFAASLSFGALDGSNGFRIDGIDEDDWSGRTVSSAGDVNGDGFDDIIIGSLFADPGGVSNAGESYVIFGKRTAFAASLDLAALDGADGFRIDGIDTNDQSGYAVSAAGDVNGDGFDDMVVSANKADPGGRESAGESYIVFGRGPDAAVNRIGTGAGQNLTGGSFDDTLEGRGGDDRLIGGNGDDLLLGEGGNDTMIGSAGRDTLDGGSGDDRAQGSVREDSILGGGGNDTLAGNNGDDTIDGGTSDDRILGGPLNDLIYGDSGNDALAGNAGVDTIFGGTGDDDILGGADADSILGEAGDDTIVGNAGQDTLIGGSGADSILGAATGDIIRGEDGDDTIGGNGGGDDIHGDTGEDLIRGNGGNDTIDGGIGGDRILGGSGDDTIIAGRGVDTLSGNGGTDVFAFDDGDSATNIANADRITDFDRNEGDTIDLSAVDAVTGGGDSAFTFIGTAAFSNTAGELRYDSSGGKTYVTADLDGNGTADFVLELIGNIALTESDFVL